MVGLGVGLLLGLLTLIPPLRRGLSLPMMILGGVAAVSLLITLGAAKGLGASPLSVLYVLQLAAAAALFAGAIGMRVGSSWTPAVLYGAAGGWLLGNAPYLLIFLSPLAIASTYGLSITAMLLGIPTLAVVAALCCKEEGRG